MRHRLVPAIWALLAYTVVVILWGAFVRASGSGAGCGSHWPLCNGSFLPSSPSFETIVEFTHRFTSGLLGVFILALVAACFRYQMRGHPARKASLVALFFVVTESLVGAGLVKFEWVTGNDSEARVFVMAFHLVNTFLLVASIVMTGWYAEGGRTLVLLSRPLRLLVFVVASVGLLLVGASGAVTALGDTLIHQAGIQPETSPVVAELVATRFYHPTLSGVVCVVIFFIARSVKRQDSVYNFSLGRLLLILYALQLGIGALNVFLRAPVWIQLVHLGVSNVIWIVFVRLALNTLSLAAEQKAPPKI